MKKVIFQIEYDIEGNQMFLMQLDSSSSFLNLEATYVKEGELVPRACVMEESDVSKIVLDQVDWLLEVRKPTIRKEEPTLELKKDMTDLFLNSF